jgi:glucokinase
MTDADAAGVPGCVLAIDIGGSKFAAALVSPDGELVTVHKSSVDAGDDAETLFATLVAVIDRVLAYASRVGLSAEIVGVGTAGPLTPNAALVSPLNLPGWRDFPLRDRLGERLGLPVAGALDTQALALGEGWLGAAAGVKNFMAMVVSTGVGGGFVVDGELLHGASGNAGHIGHFVVVPGGRSCACGSRGCLEAEASGTAIAAMTGRSAAQAAPSMVERTGRLVGRAVASAVNLLDLELAVVAGSVALGFGEPFFAAAQAELDAHCHLAGAVRPVIRPAGLGASAPLIGAAAVGWQALSSESPDT